jgi:hypothetical protein
MLLARLRAAQHAAEAYLTWRAAPLRNLELSWKHRPTEVQREAGPALQLYIHLSREETKGAPAVRFGAVQGRVGIPEQLLWG